MFAMHDWLVVATAFVGLQQAPGLQGRWEGALGGLRLVLTVEKSADGLHFGEIISVDQGDSRIPVERITVIGDSVHLDLRAATADFRGHLSADGNRLRGTWNQSVSIPLEFTRVVAVPAPAAEPGADFSPLELSLELSTSVAPIPFSSDERSHLGYELHLGNLSLAEMPVSRIEVLDGDRIIATFEGVELSAIMSATSASMLDHRTIAPAARATAFLWLSFDSDAQAPTRLEHRVTVREHAAIGGITSVGPNAVVIGPPLRGGDWAALDGPDNAGAHRRTVVAIGGRATIPQRFATDWAKAGPDGTFSAGDRNDNSSFFSYGADVIAVADGEVSAVMDGMPDNAPGADVSGVPMALEALGGNHVIINLGARGYAVYAHLQPASIRVKIGDRVRRGDVIGLVGNSGNSSGPHLHFQISDSNSLLATEGLPYVIDAWERLNASGRWEQRVNELPVHNARVRFGGR
jgi:murein DD-endopeptidase MepM/ murein hydrolase activator NlpD